MAGDWIKMRADLQTSPKVVRIASALKADRLRVIGALHAVWCLFDVHSDDGQLDGYTLETLDDLIGFPGFGAAMCAVEWLAEGPQAIAVPRFSEHNGQSAKRRAQEAQRKRTERGQASASDADKKRTREEKRRNNPKAPSGDFELFWNAYPKKVGKDAAAKAFDKRKPDAALLAQMLAAVERQRGSEAWRKDGGQFIPNPATWLNQGRWMDECANDGASDLAALFARGG